MKKIPTVFEREYENHKVVGISDKFTSFETEYEFKHGIATVKWDGSCCAVIDGKLYKRYDAKKGKKPPVGAIPCCDPDPITGHHPHWVAVSLSNPADKWFVEAYRYYQNKVYPSGFDTIPDGTYEAIGKHFNGNPYEMNFDTLVAHGVVVIPHLPRTFEAVRDYLKDHHIEGIVFWLDGEPKCKIKKTDFGFEWNGK